MTKPPILQLDALLRRFGVDNDELLDALKWKYRKIYTEKEMVLRERDRLRADNEFLKDGIEKHVEQGIRLGERAEKAEAEIDRLRKALTLVLTDLEGYPASARPCHAFDAARAALAKEGK